MPNARYFFHFMLCGAYDSEGLCGGRSSETAVHLVRGLVYRIKVEKRMPSQEVLTVWMLRRLLLT